MSTMRCCMAKRGEEMTTTIGGENYYYFEKIFPTSDTLEDYLNYLWGDEEEK